MDTINLTPLEQMRHCLPPPAIRSLRRNPTTDEEGNMDPCDFGEDAETPYDIPENDSPARWR